MFIRRLPRRVVNDPVDEAIRMSRATCGKEDRYTETTLPVCSEGPVQTLSRVQASEEKRTNVRGALSRGPPSMTPSPSRFAPPDADRPFACPLALFRPEGGAHVRGDCTVL